MIVAVIARGVGEANEVEPEDRHPLAEMRRCNQPVDQAFVRRAARVVLEVADLERGGRQPEQVEAQPADERSPVRRRRRLQAVLARPALDEPIDLPAPGPCAVFAGACGRDGGI